MAKLVVGVNDLATTHPKLAKEWDFDKNGDLKPTNVTFGSSKKVWWQCKHGHEWEAVISNRSKGRGCPYCSNKKVLAGFNDLATKNPKLALEWHPTKNGKLKPTDVTAYTDKKIWWKCSKGHEWQTTIDKRSRGMGCPYCSNKKTLAGFNDLTTINPKLAKEWHPTKNNDLKPMHVTTHSGKKVWWKCDKGHEWRSTVNNRSQGKGCPYCSNQKVLPGYNDLATKNPQLASEWHPTKNGNLKPTNFIAGSHKKVWWKCKFEHEWQATIGNRSRGDGCPYCSSNGTSLPEMIVLYYFKKYSNAKIKHRYKDLGFELDLYFKVDNQKIGIEYDGAYSHRNKKTKDLNKNKQCKKNDIKLYRIRELPLTKLNDTSIDFTYNHHKKQELADIISQLIKEIFNKSVEIDIDKDSAEINILVGTLEKENSLVTTHPELAKQWHPTKNSDLKPTNVTFGSHKKVWWQCKKGHEWEAIIKNRSNSDNCPYCSGHRVLVGFNDLATKNPQLAKQWNFNKNNNLKPIEVTCKSNKKVWWQCDKGHEWEAIIKNRSQGKGCPHCYKEKQKNKNQHPKIKIATSNKLQIA